ncbi:hypothetical protein Cni_G20391 [Canna indica]|uniref:Uncharacterized protein n=1 Tax=Canna indica TaxID=4628 RepID=A0AAQ3KTL6_9LILI|nr:hypothetical protein Cni_G20391 [Canna indica]
MSFWSCTVSYPLKYRLVFIQVNACKIAYASWMSGTYSCSVILSGGIRGADHLVSCGSMFDCESHFFEKKRANGTKT